ncbi:DUF3606 domain-containing protein [Ideonella azotifigens]|uniref:DUF3606 domain-containing protein n=1 Tax=Ideonella azotifigens TaxID=513160 RepID=A0ABN1K8W5_9BURK|nr:DUF3606 domain-containing protein [Ideonella azotifigens]MCD2342823.1 DUF3606 domain-containing protein [Ideonella azotifigens]
MPVAFYEQDLKNPVHLSAHDPAQADYWASRLGVSVPELRQAVDAVGTALHAVQQYLGCADSPSLGWAPPGTTLTLGPPINRRR